MQLAQNKILITGGASGIGRGLTERFLKEKNTVIICGRRDAALQEMAAQHPGLITRQCDLEQLNENRQQLTFGFSEAMTKAGPDQQAQTLNRMNP